MKKILICLLLVACQSTQKNYSTKDIATASKIAETNVDQAIDSKDKIYQLEKQNLSYDYKEYKLLNH